MKRKTIYINGRFLCQKLTGVQRFALETVLALDAIAKDYPDYDFVLLSPQDTLTTPDFSHIKHERVGWLSGVLWENLELPIYCKAGFLVNLGNTAPVFKRDQMVVIHDLAVYSYPQNFNFKFRAWYKSLYYLLKKIGVKFATVSEFSQSEIHHFLKMPMQDIAVLTEGKDHIDAIEPDLSILARHDLIDTAFVLAVGSVKPNKNFSIVAKLLERQAFKNVKFVIAGGFNTNLFKDIEELPDSIVQAGYVTDEELKALYQHAACFVFPSLYEGFGIPPLEAMACGCPVICANTSSIPEVCEEAVLYFEPDDLNTLQQHLSVVLSDQAYRAEMIEAGHQQANRFSWRKNAVLLIERCINTHIV